MNINKYINPSYIMKAVNFRLKKLLFQYTWPIRPKGSIYIFQTIQDFMINQYIKKDFNRLDIIVRFLAIEQFYNQNGIGFELYKKMQLKRVGEDTLDSFKTLISSVQKLGMDNDQPIDLDADMQLRNGAHRVACALFFQNNFVSVKINRKARNIRYNKDWFINSDFNNTEMEQINQRLKDLVKQTKIYFKAIIWPDSVRYKKTIIKRINMDCDIYNVEEKTFTENQFYDFVSDVYLIDDIHDDRIDKKNNNFKNTLKNQKFFTVCIIDLFIPNPNFRMKYPTNHKISIKVEQLKKDIRELIKPKLEKYFHDSIIHIGDNYYHTVYIENCINETGD